MIKYLLTSLLIIGNACNGISAYKNGEYSFPYKSVIKEIPEKCVESNEDQIIEFGNELENMFMNKFGKNVTVSDEREYGKKMNDLSEETLILVEDERSIRLQQILNKLKPNTSRKGIPYSIRLVDDSQINAWTHAGGYIYVTTELLDYVSSEDELAFVIAHEISHNENEHCKKSVQRLMTAIDLTGDVTTGEYANTILGAIFMPFNQHQELEADLAGLYLVYSAGYNPEKSNDFFNKLSKQENANSFDKFLRTHPWSKDRISCVRSYLNEARK